MKNETMFYIAVFAVVILLGYISYRIRKLINKKIYKSLRDERTVSARSVSKDIITMDGKEMYRLNFYNFNTKEDLTLFAPTKELYDGVNLDHIGFLTFRNDQFVEYQSFPEKKEEK